MTKIDSDLAELLFLLASALDKKLSSIDKWKKKLITEYTKLNEKASKNLERNDLNPKQIDNINKIISEIDETGHNIQNLTLGLITELESVKITAFNAIQSKRQGFFRRLTSPRWTKSIKALNKQLSQVLRDVKNVATILKTIEFKLGAISDKVK